MALVSFQIQNSKGLLTPNKSEREGKKDQRTIGRDQKNKLQTSKKIFAFAWCGQAVTIQMCCWIVD